MACYFPQEKLEKFLLQKVLGYCLFGADALLCKEPLYPSWSVMCPKGLVCCFGGSFLPPPWCRGHVGWAELMWLVWGSGIREGAQEAALLHRVDCLCNSLSLWQGSFHLQEDDSGKWEGGEVLLCLYVPLWDAFSHPSSMLTEEAIDRVLIFFSLTRHFLGAQNGSFSSLMA